jgi:hypothetical protein
MLLSFEITFRKVLVITTINGKATTEGIRAIAQTF